MRINITTLFSLFISRLRYIFSINKIIKLLVLSDIFILSGSGLLSPVFAVFLSDNITGGTLAVIGIADFIYLGSKSLVQIPTGILIDKTKGEKIDFWFAFIGSLMSSISMLLYVFASLPWHIYVIQLIFGIGMGIAYPAWMGLFTRNMDSGKESFVWSLHSTFVDVASAFAAGLGGILAEKFGFNFLIYITFVLSLTGCIFFLGVYEEVKNG